MPEDKKEMVNHPDHYQGISGKYECIDVMQNVFGQEMTESFCILNAFKYLYRCNAKGKRTEDLKKADWYIRYAVDHSDGENGIH